MRRNLIVCFVIINPSASNPASADACPRLAILAKLFVVVVVLDAGRGVTVGVAIQLNIVSLENVTYCSQSVMLTGGKPKGVITVEQTAVVVGA